jgi:NAD(P)-dependent dehydrogenase (short-subunit alcohol dehydrogenase family)
MRVKLKPLHEQVVVLVGATSGIGRETAFRMSERGARLVLSARSETELDELVEQIERRGAKLLQFRRMFPFLMKLTVSPNMLSIFTGALIVG